MILDLKKLKRSGKDNLNFFFDYNPVNKLIDLPGAQLVLPVKVNGTVSMTGDHSAYVETEICYEIKGECTRCLKETTKEYVISVDEEVSEDNPDGYKVKNDTIDLSKIVDDAITINSPVSFLCKDDCKGICTGCGVNLNDEECKCKNK